MRLSNVRLCRRCMTVMRFIGKRYSMGWLVVWVLVGRILSSLLGLWMLNRVLEC